MQIARCLAHRPQYVEETVKGYHFVSWGGSLPRTLRETVAVWVSRENECSSMLPAHAALLQAAGMKSKLALRFTEGELHEEELSSGELAIAELVHKSVITPALLEPRHLAKVSRTFGVGGAVEIVGVLAAFHLISRVADLIGLRSDLTWVQRHWAWARRLGLRSRGWKLRRSLDLENRKLDIDAAAALLEAHGALGPLPDGYEALLDVPSAAGFLLSMGRIAKQLDPDMLARVTQGVAAALPTDVDEVTGFHERPSDPLDELVFVGTRYAARSTDAMVTAVREKYGYGDAELTDLFYAIGMRNAIERMHRLFAAVPSGG